MWIILGGFARHPWVAKGQVLKQLSRTGRQVKAKALLAFYNSLWSSAPLLRSREARNMWQEDRKGDIFIILNIKDTFPLYPRVYCFWNGFAYAVALSFKTMSQKKKMEEKETSQSHTVIPDMNWLSAHDLPSSVERPFAKICACSSSTLKRTLPTASEKHFYQLLVSPWVENEALRLIFTFA